MSYSLPGITRAGSKGMISARNIKAPHCCLTVQTLETIESSYVEKKKEKQPWKRVEFLSRDKDKEII